MSPTSIILCMAACFVGLVAALIVVNRFGSMSTRKLVVIAMMVAVYVVLNTVGTIRLGWINISVSALPMIVGALLYGPGGGLMVGLVGAFLGQLMTYGVTATTVLWIIPPAVRGLLIGLYAKRCGFERCGVDPVALKVGAHTLIEGRPMPFCSSARMSVASV